MSKKLGKYFFFLFCLMAFPELMKAESPEFTFGGYVYMQPAAQVVPKDNDFIGEIPYSEDVFATNLTRLRLKPVIEWGFTGRLEMHYEVVNLLTKVPLITYYDAPLSNRQAVNLSWNIVEEENVQMRHYIDRLYYKHFFDWGEVVLGRQRISWGVGRVWQPTDLFNPINPANFSKFEKDGADALSSKIYIGNFTDLEMVVNFRERLDQTNFGTRFRTNFKEYDLSVMSGMFDGRGVIGGDFAGNLFDAGIRGEVIFSFDRDRFGDNFTRLILGADYQFTEKLYALVEYQFNGEGSTDKSDYNLGGLFTGEILNVSRNYVTTTVNYQIHPLWTVSANYLQNINDGSGFAAGRINWNALQNLNVSLAGNYFFGSNLSEYNFFPSAVYLLGEYYF